MSSFYINIQLTVKENNDFLTIFLSLLKNFVWYRLSVEFTEFI